MFTGGLCKADLTVGENERREQIISFSMQLPD